MQNFSFTAFPVIYFGIGKLEALENMVSKTSGNALIISCNSFINNGIKNKIVSSILNKKNIRHHYEIITGEPSPEVVDTICDKHRKSSVELVIGIGGGSTLDAGKAVSAMLQKDDSVINYLEGVGTKTHDGLKVPYIAIPTTSGTGSEMTKNAVLSKPGINGFKKSLRHDRFIPDIAIVDPELTKSCPPQITAAAGMDALTQLVESYLSVKSSRLSDAFALDGIKCILESIENAVADGNDLKSRSKMAYGAMLSGITLANAGLGLTHGFAGTIGGMFQAPHGIICGTLMGIVNRKNLEKAINLEIAPVIEKYAELGKMLQKSTNRLNDEELAYLFVDKIDSLVQSFALPELAYFGMQQSDVEKVIKKTGLKNNPVTYSEQELNSILESRI